MDDPIRHLTPPIPADGLAADHVTITAFMDAISLTFWLNESIDAMLGFNILNEVAKPLVGDWKAVATFGVALEHTARSLQDVGTNVQQSIVTLDQSWEGNASDAAYRYFSDLATRISGIQSPLNHAADEYRSLSNGMWAANDVATGIAKTLADAALISIIAAAAATVTAETGVGALVGYGVAAIEITRMLELANKLTDLIAKVNTYIYGFYSVAKVTSAQLGTLKNVQLPGAYDNPALP